MKVQIQSKKFIKPSTPTPPSLRNYNLSFLDELAPAFHVPFVLYYHAALGNSTKTFSVLSSCNQLEKSLELILTRYYPLAGRYIKHNCSIDCNDQGVQFVIAKVDTQLQGLLGLREAEELNHLIPPCEIGAVDEVSDPLLSIQLTIFACGGLAIGGCCPHMIADAFTLATFFSGWATACREESVDGICPSLNSASFFPRRGLDRLALGAAKTEMSADVSVTKMFTFNEKDISRLRAIYHGRRVNPTGKSKPSSVQLVNAIIWKALIGLDRAKHSPSRAYIAAQPVFLGGITTLRIPHHTFGNLLGLATAQYKIGEGHNMDFRHLVDLLGGSVKKHVEDCEKLLSSGEDGYKIVIDPIVESNKNLSDSEVNFSLFTSWSKFPFYEVDFGWGKPVWATVVHTPVKNLVILMDDIKSGGIEAWVHLDKRDMPYFEQDCKGIDGVGVGG
ncbi:hypothetical protein RJ640_018554 [Escallonia rubra]|uniref:Uncharacterized protein n=1 Tax=Escallonia rubra TaxID=112253 RepID=A0AA88RJB1_9ASTE|nr:hypothetical protein RJ640_018554 [Escallonia rubra]